MRTRGKTLSSFLFIVTLAMLAIMLTPLASAATWPDNDTMHGPDIMWSGRTWWVADWAEYRADYVSIDASGYLHLKQSGHGDSGIISYDRCGFGVYTWVMAGVHEIHPNGVIGMNPYLSVSTDPEQYHEIDIEQAKWGSPNAPNFDFWVQPGSAQAYRILNVNYTNLDTTFIIEWQHTYINFYVIDSGVVRHSWNASQIRDATGVYAVTNYWHYLNPTSIQDEAVFKSFSYVPGLLLPNSPINLVNNTTPSPDDHNATPILPASSDEDGTFQWQIPAMVVGGFVMLAALVTRNSLLFIAGVVVIAVGYLSMGGVLISALTGA